MSCMSVSPASDIWPLSSVQSLEDQSAISSNFLTVQSIGLPILQTPPVTTPPPT